MLALSIEGSHVMLLLVFIFEYTDQKVLLESTSSYSTTAKVRTNFPAGLHQAHMSESFTQDEVTLKGADDEKEGLLQLFHGEDSGAKRSAFQCPRIHGNYVCKVA